MNRVLGIGLAMAVAATCVLSSAAAGQDFIRVSGRNLVLGPDAQTIRLRGINSVQAMFVVIDSSQWVLDDPDDRGVPEYDRLNEQMFADIAALGMNVVRLDLNYRYFEDNAAPGVYKQQGWDLLDRAVAWARAHRLYLTLSMVVPAGGFQPSGGGGAPLWDEPVMRDRFLDLWSAIAARYANEPVIAGYDLLNEPNPTASASQWRDLAQTTIDRIRLVDPNHLVIVERVNYIVDATGHTPPPDAEPWLFLVNDANAMYDDHFYDLLDYTQQLVDRPEFGPYPNPDMSFYDHDGTFLGVWDRDYLAGLLDERIDFGRLNGVPMNIGEWGPNIPAFARELGAIQYTRDTGELLDERGLNDNYFTYDRVFFYDWMIAEQPILARVGAQLVELIQSRLGQCRIDLDADGAVGVGDFFKFIRAFVRSSPLADLDTDGRVGVADFFVFVAAFAAGCP